MEHENTVEKKRGIRGMWASLVSPGKKRRLAVVLGVVVVIVAVVTVAALTGRLAVVLKSPNQRVSVVQAVCDTTVVDKFNTLMDAYYGGVSSEETMKALNSLESNFSKDAAYAQDSTCLFIQYRAAIVRNNYADAKQAVDQLQQRIDAGVFVDGRIDGLASMSSIRQTLDQLAPEQIEEMND